MKPPWKLRLRRAPSIALIGPDGAGKTTLARMLVRSERLSLRYLYMGINTSSSNVALPTSRWIERMKRRRETANPTVPSGPGSGRDVESSSDPAPGSGTAPARPASAPARARGRRIRGAARLANRLAEEWFRQLVSWSHQWRGHAVLYDRHFAFDFGSGELTDGPVSLDRKLHRWFLEHLYPRPDLVILLDAPGTILFARKGESTPEELERRRRALLAQAARVPRFIRVDATRPLEDVYDEVASHVRGFCGNGTDAPGTSASPMSRRRLPAPRSNRSAGSLRVLTYHRVIDPGAAATGNPSVVSAHPHSFERQVRHLARRYRVVPVEQVVEAMLGHAPLPHRAVLLTFDDAYRDFGEIAWPILRRHGLPATLFVPTAFPDRPEAEFWWDRLHRAVTSTRRRGTIDTPLGPLPLNDRDARRGTLRTLQGGLKELPHDRAMQLIDELMGELGVDTPPPHRSVLSWRELRELARDGATIAPHTRTHPALDRLPPERLDEEVRGSGDELRRHIGRSAPIFAYPFGRFDERTVRAVRDAGFEVALTCEPGHNDLARIDPLRMRRTNVGLRTSPRLLRVRLLGPVSRVERRRRLRARASGGR